MIQVAGRIVKHAGKVILKVAADTKKLMLFQDVQQEIFESRLSVDGYHSQYGLENRKTKGEVCSETIGKVTMALKCCRSATVEHDTDSIDYKISLDAL